MFANKIQKNSLVEFWSIFGKRRTLWPKFDPGFKLDELRRMSRVFIPYRQQLSIDERRERFSELRVKKQSPAGKKCFVCSNPAQCRHHIIQLKHGGINAKKNIVTLCDACHAKIHPWL